MSRFTYVNRGGRPRFPRPRFAPPNALRSPCMRALYPLYHSRAGSRSLRRTPRAFIPAIRQSVPALKSLLGAIDRAIERSPKIAHRAIASSLAIASHPRTHLLPDSRTRHSHAPRAYTAHTSTRVSDTTTHPTARGRKYAAQLHICIHMRSFHCIVRVEQTRSVGVPCSGDVGTPTSILDTHYLYANTPCDP